MSLGGYAYQLIYNRLIDIQVVSHVHRVNAKVDHLNSVSLSLHNASIEQQRSQDRIETHSRES